MRPYSLKRKIWQKFKILTRARVSCSKHCIFQSVNNVEKLQGILSFFFSFMRENIAFGYNYCRSNKAILQNVLTLLSLGFFDIKYSGIVEVEKGRPSKILNQFSHVYENLHECHST